VNVKCVFSFLYNFDLKYVLPRCMFSKLRAIYAPVACWCLCQVSIT